MNLPHGILRTAFRERSILRIDELREKYHPLAGMRESFSLISRIDAAFVNKSPESVTLTWIVREGPSVQMTWQQELVLA